MSFLTRNYGKLFVLILVVGLALGALLARRGVQINLGTVAGRKLALTTAQPTQTAGAGLASAGGGSFQGNVPVGAGQAITGTAPAGGQTFARPLSGAVQSVDGQTITLLGSDGSTSKATVGDSTAFSKNITATVGDLKAGDTVTAAGQRGADGTITAQQITVGDVTPGATAFGGGQGGFGGQGGQRGGTGASGGGQGAQGAQGGQLANLAIAAGTIQAINGNTITIAGQNGQTSTVAVDANTRLRKSESAKLSDVTAGEQVTVVGQAGADGAIAATLVTIGALR